MAEVSAQPPQSGLAACEYKTGKTLGQGSYGVVKEGVKISTSEKFAIKVISKKLMRGKEAFVINEIHILKKISRHHKNIVTLYDTFESPNNLYLVMDLCTGGELFDRIAAKGHFFEQDAIKIIRCIVGALEFLHRNGVVHRDVKPENLIFKSPEEDADLMLTDFGLSRMFTDGDEGMMKTYAGTLGYMAPEIIQRLGHGKAVDMWSIGVLSYFLLSGELPFDSASNAEESQRVIKGDYNFNLEIWSELSSESKDFVHNLIVVDPKGRLTAEDALLHSWLAPARISVGPNKDLFPKIRQGFDAKKMFKRALYAVKAINKLSHSNLNLSGSSSSLATNGGGSNDSLDQPVTIHPSKSIDNLFVAKWAGINQHKHSLSLSLSHSKLQEVDNLEKGATRS